MEDLLGLSLCLDVFLTCFQCLQLATYKNKSELKFKDKVLFILLPCTFLFWITLKISREQENK